ncbi:uncharacterized protein HD556DRAFT_1445847 [Suillus plorans]|uniref:CCL2-like lectin domain-containing protein n=1 Tax=Suillus plorans TaxID=116603 RepID=A0A9P7AKS9_9AGAM|nr:uncharacterized protein HD556DRAFT_1445847 [Suillus plorans]KAG1790827.1 hypothetical protein HD556DRAFT_1445847 [Suillus plorans]
MTKPPAPGTYVIVNKALSPNNERLAITYNGLDQPLTVNIKTDSSHQRWIVQDHDQNTKSLVPVDATALQAAWGADCATALPAHSYVWTITETDSGYSIQDGVGTAFWGVADAVDNAPLVAGSDTGDEKHRWSFERVL